MPGKVVLVRHGQAQARGAVPDHARELTATGRALLRKAYPEPFGTLLTDGASADDVSVWASAATRAEQTAEVICDVVGIRHGRMSKLGMLTTQDEDAILDAVRRDNSKVLVVVGHSPSLDSVASALSGRLRILTQGEALCLDMTAGRGNGSPVMWDCRPTLATGAR